jgi:hypothetical protein
VKQEAWTKNKFDEVFAKKGRFEKADVPKQNAVYTPTVNTHVNIIKNKLPNVFAKKGRFKNADVTTLKADADADSQHPGEHCYEERQEHCQERALVRPLR